MDNSEIHGDNQSEYGPGELAEADTVGEVPFSPDLIFTCNGEQEPQYDEGLPDINLPCLGAMPDNPMAMLSFEEDAEILSNIDEVTENVRPPDNTDNTQDVSDVPRDIPLHVPIDLLGDPDLPEHEKIVNVFSVGDFLRSRNVSATLIAEVEQASESLRPLGALVLARKPEDPGSREGRGDYHENIPVGDASATVYVKGTGATESFDQEPGDFTGFPSDPEKVLYDDTGFRGHARVVGAESVRGALLEMINAAEIFAQAANDHGMEHIEDAVAAGVTIPLNVLEFPELSKRMGALLEQRRAGNDSPIDAQALNWDGYDRLGTVEMIVPSAARLTHGLLVDGDLSNAAELLADCNTARASGRTLRALADMGWVFCASSAHFQNLYRPTEGKDALLTQADNSDIYPLGDIEAVSMCNGVDDSGNEITVNASAETRRTVAMFDQLNRRDQLVPVHAPIHTDELRVEWERVVAAGTEFWSEMLKDIAVPEAIEKAVRYLPFMRTEITMAAAQLIVEHGDHQKWEEAAAQRRDTLAQFERQYGLLSEYKSRLEGIAPNEDPLPPILDAIQNSGRLETGPIKTFLTTGDAQAFDDSPMLSKAVSLSEAIETIPDHEARDEMLSLCSYVFGARNVLLLYTGPDPVASFEGRHCEVLKRLIEDDRTADAISALKALAAAVRMSTKYCSDRSGETAGHKYSRLLLEPDADYETISQLSMTEKLVYDLSMKAANAGQGLHEMLRQKLDKTEPPLDVNAAVVEEGYPGVHDVATLALHHLSRDRGNREAIIRWATKYTELSQRLDSVRNPSADDVRTVITELDEWTNQFAPIIPELALLHDSYAAGKLTPHDRERAEQHFNRGVDYYHTALASRASAIGMPVESFGDHSNERSPETEESIRQMYQDMGLGQVASLYDRLEQQI